MDMCQFYPGIKYNYWILINKHFWFFGTCYAKLPVGKREQGTGNGEQGEEKIFCHNIQKYGLFFIHRNPYEIFLFRFCILCTQEPHFLYKPQV